MAREFLRLGIDKTALAEIHGGRLVLVNPEWTEVLDGLRMVQQRCRKNVLTDEDARQVWQAVMEAGQPSAWAGQRSCPEHFAFGIEATVLQMVRLAEGLVGLSVGRQKVEPGQHVEAPVTDATDEAKRLFPSRWLEAVLLTFWTHLTDDEIEGLERWCLQTVMENAIRASGCRSAYRAHRRRLQIDQLFRGIAPGYTTELADATRRIAAELTAVGKTEVVWKEFKQRWPSVATRYQGDLLPLLDGSSLPVSGLSRIHRDRRFALGLGAWRGEQRLFQSAPQVVFRIRYPALYEEYGAKGGQYVPLLRLVRRVAESPGHPTTATTVGWLRVHIDDDHRICFVDEVQSDVMEVLEKKNEQEEARILQNVLGEWHFHGFASVSSWARKIGYRPAIHSRQSAAAKPGMTQSERKWNTYYQSIIKRFSLREEQVEGYPAAIFVDAGEGGLLGEGASTG